MVIQGAAGNIAPKYFDSAETPIDARGPQYIRYKTALEDMATVVCEKLSEKIESIKVSDVFTVRMFSKETLFYADVPSLLVAEKIAEDAMNNCGIDGTKWLKEVKRLHDIGVDRQEETIEVQYFTVGKWCIWSLLIYYEYFNRVFPLERDSASKLIEFIVENI